ncbi:MAG: DUF4388 domain-containing protein [bacterium]
MELEGSLKAFSLPEVLQFLAMGKMTGALSLRRGDYDITLMIRAGKIVNSSALDRPRKLGQMLVQRNVLKRSNLEDALQQQKTSDQERTPLGQILIEKGLLSADGLRQVIRLQLEEEIWDLFSWKEGFFKFEHGEDKIGPHIAVEIDIEPLLIEGTRRMDEWERILRNIPNDETVVNIKPVGSDANLQAELTDNEWYVLSLVSGHYDMSSIVARSGIGKFETYRIVNTFIANGWTEIIPRAIVPPPLPDFSDEEATAPLIAAATDASSAEDSSLSRGFLKRNIFGRKSAAPKEKSPTSDGISCETRIGLLASFVSRYVTTLLQQGDFPLAKEDDLLLEQHWYRALMKYPKADLISVQATRVDVRRYERYAMFLAGSNALQVCQEDAQESLLELFATFFHLAVQRLGEKNAHRITSQLISQFDEKGSVRREEGLKLSQLVHKVLKN